MIKLLSLHAEEFGHEIEKEISDFALIAAGIIATVGVKTDKDESSGIEYDFRRVEFILQLVLRLCEPHVAILLLLFILCLDLAQQRLLLKIFLVKILRINALVI